MNPADLPLHDIHLPAPIGWWPPAIGWWLLLVVFIFVLLGVAYYLTIRTPQPKVLRGVDAALQELRQLEQRYPPNSAELLRELSVFLRRVAISWYGRQSISGLTGQAWLSFLDEKAGKPLFRQRFEGILTELPYTAKPTIDTASLVRTIREWLKLQKGNKHV